MFDILLGHTQNSEIKCGIKYDYLDFEFARYFKRSVLVDLPSNYLLGLSVQITVGNKNLALFIKRFRDFCTHNLIVLTFSLAYVKTRAVGSRLNLKRHNLVFLILAIMNKERLRFSRAIREANVDLRKVIPLLNHYSHDTFVCYQFGKEHHLLLALTLVHGWELAFTTHKFESVLLYFLVAVGRMYTVLPWFV